MDGSEWRVYTVSVAVYSLLRSTCILPRCPSILQSSLLCAVLTQLTGLLRSQGESHVIGEDSSILALLCYLSFIVNALHTGMISHA